jgi:hypothetical protein
MRLWTWSLLVLLFAPEARTECTTRQVQVVFENCQLSSELKMLRVKFGASYAIVKTEGGDLYEGTVKNGTITEHTPIDDIPQFPQFASTCPTTEVIKRTASSGCLIQYTVACTRKAPWTIVAASDDQDVTVDLSPARFGSVIAPCGESRFKLAGKLLAAPAKSKRMTLSGGDEVNVHIRRSGEAVVSFSLSVSNQTFSVRVVEVPDRSMNRPRKDGRTAAQDVSIDKNKRANGSK